MSILSPFDVGSLRVNKEALLRDFRVAVRSRFSSVLGRQEVLGGRAKFGIFGDGKEVAQLAMAYAFKPGDIRAGYYRDQTFMLAIGALTVRQMFAQLYAHADHEAEPATAGRAMNGHFATRFLDEEGNALPLVDLYNSTVDLSPTAAQMPKLVGLGYASKIYRSLPELALLSNSFTRQGNEVAFGTIGNASCAEGLFWEAVNAIGVLQVPVVLSIWDDGYGISVPNRFQMTKGDVGKAVEGFRRRSTGGPGIDIHPVVGWDYQRLCETFLRATDEARREHVPAILHVTDLTQPLGHSTSGSHERYKTAERLAWEKDFDCLTKMREWVVSEGIASADQLGQIEAEEKDYVREQRDLAWEAYRRPLEQERAHLVSLLHSLEVRPQATGSEVKIRQRVERARSFTRRELLRAAHDALVETRAGRSEARDALGAWYRAQRSVGDRRYGSHLYSETARSALRVEGTPPQYGAEVELRNGFEILNLCFDHLFDRYPNLVAMGEDVGQLGDVNQGMAHLQEKYGELRVTDTGIREATILGQAIGLAQRGLRPIAEIQYLDYVLYALQIMSDELATLRWRSRGAQAAPVILRTRGHRLEGIWHSGSPMAGILNLCRGIFVCVPRDATRAAGFYNTLAQSDDTGLVVEVLNGYRRKERCPTNLRSLAIPLGVPDVVRQGGDLTVVTYGALVSIAMEAAEELADVGIDAEIVDVQTLLPFDRRGRIAESVRKTNRVLFLDEDVPGGASAYMMQQVLVEHGAFDWLDTAPRTLSATAHRPAYGNDGDYFSKPQREDIFETSYSMMREADPRRFPQLD